jgi:hypothetical protein
MKLFQSNHYQVKKGEVSPSLLSALRSMCPRLKARPHLPPFGHPLPPLRGLCPRNAPAGGTKATRRDRPPPGPPAFFLALCFVSALSLSAQSPARTFDDLFPALDPAIKAEAFSEEGFTNCVPGPDGLVITSNIAPILFTGKFAAGIAAGTYTYISENLLVVPHTKERPVTLLDIYNSLQRVRMMTTIKYHSFTRNKWVPLFEDAGRIESPERQKIMPDPGTLYSIPDTETLYIKLKDINLGNTIYRSELISTGNALLYTITNHKASSLLLVTVIKPEGFVSRIYLEPLEEGVLVYCVACIHVPGFIDRMIDMPSALKKRLDVLVEWALTGLQTG